MMRRGMLPIIMLPDGDLRFALHLVPFWILTIWGNVHKNNIVVYQTAPVWFVKNEYFMAKIDVCRSLLPSDRGWDIKMTSHPNSNASFINIWDRLIWWRSPNLTRSSKLAAAPNCWACTLHNLGWTWTSVSEKIATCSDELGHGRPRKKYRTQTRVSVNTKHQFTSFWLRPSSDSDAWTEIFDVYSVNAP